MGLAFKGLEWFDAVIPWPWKPVVVLFVFAYAAIREEMAS
jgi:hypothetical protein